MKKILFLLLFMTVGFFSFSEESNSQEGTSYAKFVPLDNVASHHLGWKVWYKDNTGTEKIAYLPTKWFVSAGAGSSTRTNIKGFIIYKENITPYMQVFYKDGKFNHVNIILNPNFSSNNGEWRLVNIYNTWQEAPNSPTGDVYEVGDLKAEFDKDDLQL